MHHYFLFMIKNNPGADEDILLVGAICKGDQQALGKLYDKYAPALMGIISRIVPTDIIADEILQQVFQHLWNEAGLFDASRNSVFTWLINIARHAAIDKARSEQLKKNTALHKVYTNSNNKNDTANHTVPVEMQLFELVYYKGLTCAEAATVQQLPAEEIKNHIRLAIKKLVGVKV